MIYRHENFQIDTDKQIVYDKLGVELRIFGKEYLMLEKLCRDKQASHSELAQMLGYGELYIGKELKELMSRINAKIGGDAINFDGEKFRLQGELETSSEVYIEPEQQPVQDRDESKNLLPKLQKSLGLVIMIGVCILVAVWLIKFLLDSLL